MRTASVGVLFSALAFLPSLCQAQGHDAKLYQEFHNTLGNFTALYIHPTWDDFSGSFEHLPNHMDLWWNWGVFGEDHPLITDDTLVMSITSHHETAPHGEGPGGFSTFISIVEAGADEFSKSEWVDIESDLAVHRHGQHFDGFLAKGFVKLNHFLGIDSIVRWNALYTGAHSVDPNVSLSIDSDSLRDAVVPPSASEDFGEHAMNIDPSTGAFELASALNGITQADLLHASLHLGGPGQNGPEIYDLGGPTDWTDGDGSGVTRIVNDVFPEQHLGALLSGQVYVLVQTQQFPNGAIRGQMSLTPYGVAPNTVRSLRGRIVSGDPDEAAWSDNARVVASSFLVLHQGEAPVQLEFVGQSWFRNPQVLQLALETAASVGNVSQTLQLYDWQAQGYESVDTRQTTLTDGKARVYVHNNPARFVAADGSVKALLQFMSIPGANPQWQVSVDQLRWRLYR
jgi:hypothetical protein